MKRYRQASLYYVVTLIAFIINLLVYSYLIYECHVQYLLAATIGFILQNILDYIAERMWVFNKTRVRPMEGYARSFGVALFVLGLVLALTFISFHILGMNYLWARIFAGIIAGAVSFFFDAKFTFLAW